MSDLKEDNPESFKNPLNSNSISAIINNQSLLDDSQILYENKSLLLFVNNEESKKSPNKKQAHTRKRAVEKLYDV